MHVASLKYNSNVTEPASELDPPVTVAVSLTGRTEGSVIEVGLDKVERIGVTGKVVVTEMTSLAPPHWAGMLLSLGSVAVNDTFQE